MSEILFHSFENGKDDQHFLQFGEQLNDLYAKFQQEVLYGTNFRPLTERRHSYAGIVWATNEEKAVAFGTLTRYPGDRFELTCSYVCSDFRHRGIWRRTIEMREQMAIAQGGKRISALLVDDDLDSVLKERNYRYLHGSTTMVKNLRVNRFSFLRDSLIHH